MIQNRYAAKRSLIPASLKYTAWSLAIAVLAAPVSAILADPSPGMQGSPGTTATRQFEGNPLDHPSRTDDDRKRDEGFKPLEVYRFFGVENGMTVADLWPGRGYHTHILSLLAGKQGKVLAVLGPLYLQSKYEERVRKSLNERIEAGKLENVQIVGPLDSLSADSIDVMITVRNYHDLGEAPERIAVLPDLMRVLKPGGILGVVDAYTPKEGRDEDHHRINEDLVIKEITGAGFELVARSEILNNPEDTYEFDGREEDAPIHRYFIHRFVHKFRKPAR